VIQQQQVDGRLSYAEMLEMVKRARNNAVEVKGQIHHYQ
jgi:hypothetical protein